MRIKHSERDPDTIEREPVQAWELFNGCMRLYICGPGVASWWPVTSPSSSTIHHGTSHERNIARRAVLHLARRFHATTNATPEDIRDALEKYGWTPDPFTTYPSSNDRRGHDSPAD